MANRAFDILASAFGLLIASPLLPVIALAIKFDSPGPIFYRQLRVGLNGAPFRILKFRTMGTDAESKGAISVKADARVTRVGRWLRRFELDEVPTLMNVLMGDMSIVGPRPEVPSYVENYSAAERRVLTVRPGMTDLGTLRYRNETEMLDGEDDSERVYREKILPDKLNLNLEYVDKRSFLFDLRIIFATLFLIVSRKRG